jgi:hypothetical protein
MACNEINDTVWTARAENYYPSGKCVRLGGSIIRSAKGALEESMLADWDEILYLKRIGPSKNGEVGSAVVFY